MSISRMQLVCQLGIHLRVPGQQERDDTSYKVYDVCYLGEWLIPPYIANNLCSGVRSMATASVVLLASYRTVSWHSI